MNQIIMNWKSKVSIVISDHCDQELIMCYNWLIIQLSKWCKLPEDMTSCNGWIFLKRNSMVQNWPINVMLIHIIHGGHRCWQIHVQWSKEDKYLTQSQRTLPGDILMVQLSLEQTTTDHSITILMPQVRELDEHNGKFN